MALSDLIIQKGQIIVIISSSVTQVVPATGGSALSFGTVQKVSDLEDFYTVGQSVCFDQTRATQFMIISGIIFFLINTSDIKLTEITPP